MSFSCSPPSGRARRDYWRHLTSWWAQRENPDVLLLTYEHMSANPAANIRRVAQFCGIPPDDALLALTRERTSLAFMLAHKALFDDRMMREMLERRFGLPAGGDAAKVRTGLVGGHERELPPEAVAMLDAAWSESVTPKLGFRNYAELDAALRASGEKRSAPTRRRGGREKELTRQGAGSQGIRLSYGLSFPSPAHVTSAHFIFPLPRADGGPGEETDTIVSGTICDNSPREPRARRVYSSPNQTGDASCSIAVNFFPRPRRWRLCGGSRLHWRPPIPSAASMR